jgi:hypothetical protein
MNDGRLRRRELLQRLLGGAAGAQLAAWIGSCAERGASQEAGATPADAERSAPRESGAASPEAEPSASLVGEAWARARALGRPLVVLVIPADPDLRWEHGRAFGHLLQYGSEDALARIAGCELVCAETAQARMALAGVPGVPDGECAALVVAQGRAAALNADLTVPSHWGDAYERGVRDRIARLESALVPLLDDAARDDPRRYQDAVPPGAAWATDTGCGIRIDGEKDLSAMLACGMGSIPVVAQRFLYYLVRE